MTTLARKLSAVADTPEQAATCAECRQSAKEFARERKALRATVRELTNKVERLNRAIQREAHHFE